MGLDPVPVNLAAIQAREAKSAASGRLAQQVASEDGLEEAYSEVSNPQAIQARLARNTRNRTLESRLRSEESKERKIKGVAEKTEDDMANRYERRHFELKKEQLLNLKRALYEGISPEEVLELVLRQYKDPSLADLALEFLEKTSEGPIKAAVTGARQIHNERSGRLIAAGHNISPAVVAYYESGIGTPTDLRNLYRNVTGTIRDHNTLFNELSKTYDFDELKIVVTFLLKGLGYDMKSKGPSIQPPELVKCMTEVRNLQSILWVYTFFKSRMKLIKALHKKGGLTLESLSFQALAKDFIRLVEERYPSVVKLLKQSENLGIMMPESKIIILSQYRDAIRNLAPRIYRSPKHKQELLHVILETLEELEDSMEEEGEL